jgi:leader peptidase (prepilin peptidase) / N-methyltransferase
MPYRLTWWDLAAGGGVCVLSLALLSPAMAAFAALLGLLAIVIARADLDSFIIPDWTVLALLVAGLGLTIFEGGLGALPDAALRAIVAAGVLYLLRFAYKWRAGIEGLGLGDVKLAGAAGPWLMWSTLPFAVAVAAVAAILMIGARALVVREQVEWRQALPFGAFLAPAIWFSFLFERLWLMPIAQSSVAALP